MSGQCILYSVHRSATVLLNLKFTEFQLYSCGHRTINFDCCQTENLL